MPDALQANGKSAAARELQLLAEAAGNENVFVELWSHGEPEDDARNDSLAALATQHNVGLLCTNVVHYAVPAQRYLARAMAAIRSRRSLDQIDGWLPANGLSLIHI